MRKIRVLIGMPVVVNNRRIGRVVQAELSEDLRQLDGLWIDAGLRGTRYLPSDSLEMLGQVAVMADDAGRRRRCKSAPLFRRAVGTDGRRLGAITGAEIDELSFRVEALELSRGLWDDLLCGRARIRNFTLNRENGSVVIDLTETEKEGTSNEERHDEGTHYRRADRRFRSDDVRRDELAGRKADEPASQEDRPMAGHQDR